MAKDERRWRYGEQEPREQEPEPVAPEPAPEPPSKPEEVRWTWGERQRHRD